MGAINFSRNSQAYNSDGSVVAANVPRFQDGKFNKGILIEEGTTNLITSGNCETDFPQINKIYTVYNINLPAFSSDFKYSGTHSMKLTTTSSSGAVDRFFQSGNYDLNGLTAGQTYTFSGFLYVPSNLGINLQNVFLRIFYYANGAFTSAVSSAMTKYDTWQRLTVTLSVPSNATMIFTRIYIWQDVLNAPIYADCMQLEQKSYATSFIDSTRQPESLTIPTANILSSKQGMVEFWANITDIAKRQNGSWNGLINITGTNNGLIMLSHSPSAPGFRFYITQDGVAASWIDIPDSSIPNGWHQFILGWDNTEAKIFVDGQLMGTIPNPKLPIDLTAITLGIGFANNFCNTIYDDLRVSSIVRSDSEIAANYVNNKPLPVDQYTTLKLNFDGDLTPIYPTLVKPQAASNLKFLRFYDRFHNILDEVYTFNNLTYTWTLNGMGKAEFNIGLEDSKCTDINLRFYNHVEVRDDTNNIIWAGVIVGRDFNSQAVHITCYGYLYLFKQRRLTAKTYSVQDYGKLYSSMINDVNAICSTGIDIGSIASGTLQTTRIVQNTDFLLDKITEYGNDVNYDYEVDQYRKFNFYLRKGMDKPYYQLEYGGDADNIVNEPGLSQSILDMENSIYTEVQNDGTVQLSSLAQDNISQSLYGLIEGVEQTNGGIATQSTLDNIASGALQRTAYPINSFTIKAKDSTLCPFSDIFIGDAVMVSLPLYFNFNTLLRIIEMTQDEDSGTRDITFGQVLLRPTAPTKRFYKK